MRINVKARTKARKEKVERVDFASYKVEVNDAAEDGKANDRIIQLLAEHFNISRQSVRLVIGQTSKQKVFDITLPEDSA